jgi:hypothetical protein
MRPEAVTATVLWTTMAWAQEGATHSPILAAISVEPDSGLEIAVANCAACRWWLARAGDSADLRIVSSDEKVFDFPKAEITSEEKVRRAMAEAKYHQTVERQRGWRQRCSSVPDARNVSRPSGYRRGQGAQPIVFQKLNGPLLTTAPQSPPGWPELPKVGDVHYSTILIFNPNFASTPILLVLHTSLDRNWRNDLMRTLPPFAMISQCLLAWRAGLHQQIHGMCR